MGVVEGEKAGARAWEGPTRLRLRSGGYWEKGQEEARKSELRGETMRAARRRQGR
eukprot:CAMPEP_0174886148 /NCGR_PEP_ID=MMETSP0167-20121228/1418_1 /TAXON_ID=38298 /ORGANISM="Rhodella maculata, Strain CCMP736" /LENGTH=54 /DNA_ID=CAMNT_0016122035 /DNA_START=402 /DNA_END=562 /DNA_ORIENTATION=-